MHRVGIDLLLVIGSERLLEGSRFASWQLYRSAASGSRERLEMMFSGGASRSQMQLTGWKYSQEHPVP
jgi:hypothetical protein